MIKDQIDLPHSYESEMMVLSSVILSKGALKKAVESLEEGDFHFKEHQILFGVLQKMCKKNLAIDIHLLSEELKKEGIHSEIGGDPYLVHLALYSGTAEFIDEFISEVKRYSILREIAINKSQADEKKELTIINVRERMFREEAFLRAHKSEMYLGLRTSTIEEFNENLLGLRGLNLLKAGSNLGKTALSIQLGLEAILEESDACFVFVSLEMSSEEIFRRMVLCLAEMDFRTLIFGRGKDCDFNRLEKAKNTLLELGDRLQIIDLASSSTLDAKTIIDFVHSLKSSTGSKRAIVVLDQLKVWGDTQTYRMDNWQIGEMLKLKQALAPDPIIVTTEVETLSEVDSIADVTMKLVPLGLQSIKALWKEHNIPVLEGEYFEKEGVRIKHYLETKGIVLCKLEVLKARDGMDKFSSVLEFHFKQNRFKKLSVVDLEKEIVASQADVLATSQSLVEFFMSA